MTRPRPRDPRPALLVLVAGLLATAGAGGCQDRRQLAVARSGEITLNVSNGTAGPVTLRSADPAAAPDRTLQPDEKLAVRFTVVRVLPLRLVDGMPTDPTHGWIEMPERQTALEAVSAPQTPFLVDGPGNTVLLRVGSGGADNWDHVIELGKCLFCPAGPYDLAIQGPQDLSGPFRLCDDE